MFLFEGVIGHIPRIRLLLKVADQVLQGMENRDRQP